MSTRTTSMHQDSLDAHPQLRADIEEVRRGDSPGVTYSDAQYACTLRQAAERFPGMELLALRPWFYGSPRRTVLHFIWSVEELLTRGILTAADVPVAPKRRVYGGQESLIVCVDRIRGGRLSVNTAGIADNSDPGHPLAMFRPTAIEESIGPRGALESWRAALTHASWKLAHLASSPQTLKPSSHFSVSEKDAKRIAAVGERFKAELFEALERADIVDKRRPQLRIVGGKDVRHG